MPKILGVYKMMSIWEQCLEKIPAYIGPEEYSLYFKSLSVSADNKSIDIYLPNAYVVNQFETAYIPTIKNILKELHHSEVKVILHVGKKPVTEEDENSNSLKPTWNSNLNPNHLFSNFIEGKSNKLAFAMGKTVASNPGNPEYNPLFIHGSTGVGKTHLLHAIGNQMMQENKKSRVLYSSSETFVNELIAALKGKRTNSFKRKYRNLDALLLDDVQFFGNKSASQEEFFNTFNTLIENNSQIILASDKDIPDIPNLEDRLKSRFSSGPNLFVESPDIDTKVAILTTKSKEVNLHLSQEVIEFLARNIRIKLNVRELEGALKTLKAGVRALEHFGDISIDFVKTILKDILVTSNANIVSITLIKEAVSKYYRLSIKDLESKSRLKKITKPRHLAFYLSKELTGKSLADIGYQFGNRDHTTVLHAIKTIKRELITNFDIQEAYKSLRSTLLN
ncbi:MAG: chromosomal replication initiator protein DnaA [Psittacicella sp.]